MLSVVEAVGELVGKLGAVGARRCAADVVALVSRHVHRDDVWFLRRRALASFMRGAVGGVPPSARCLVAALVSDGDRGTATAVARCLLRAGHLRDE